MKKLVAILLTFMLVSGVLTGCKNTTVPATPSAPGTTPSAPGTTPSAPGTTPSAPGTSTTGASKYHIGLVSMTASQMEDYVDAENAIVKEYGSVANGGMIETVTLPDNFSSEVETVVSDIVSLSDDPLTKAIVVENAITGTAEAFREIRAKRPDILLFANAPEEDPNVIDPLGNVVVDADNISRGYIIPHTAKQLGAKNLVFISFPRHMSIELTTRGWNIMQQACKDLGMKSYFQTAPDPTSEVGVAGAQQFILENVPAWIQKYGKDTAFYTTNFALAEPLLKQIMKYGGIYTEPDIPSPLIGYPGAFGIDLKAEQGNWPAILKKVEATVIADGGSGRFGTWAYSATYALCVGLARYAKECVDGTAKVANEKDLLSALEEMTPGASWKVMMYTDLNTQKTSPSHFLVYQDTYVFGKGYMGTTKIVVPQKYYTLKASAQ